MNPREFPISLKQLEGVMQRRQFCKLAGGALVLIPAGLFLVRCGGGTSDQTGNGPTNQPTQNGTISIYTSNVVADHSHTFGIEMAAIDMPPSNGVSGSSSVVGTHSHSGVLSSGPLSGITSRQPVAAPTGAAAGPPHLSPFRNADESST